MKATLRLLCFALLFLLIRQFTFAQGAESFRVVAEGGIKVRDFMVSQLNFEHRLFGRES